MARAEFVVAPLVLGGVGTGWRLRPSSASPVGDAAVRDTPRLVIGLPLAQEQWGGEGEVQAGEEKNSFGEEAARKEASASSPGAGMGSQQPHGWGQQRCRERFQDPTAGGCPPAFPGTGLPWAPPTLVSGSPQPRPEACPVLERVAGGQRESLGKDRQGDSREAQQKPLGWPRKCSSHQGVGVLGGEERNPGEGI